MWAYCTIGLPTRGEREVASGEIHKSHRKEYFVIFALLTLLTLIEIYVPEWDASKFAKGSALVALASVKAFLVAYFYMHLKDERAWLKFIACVPLAAVLFAAAVILESIHR